MKINKKDFLDYLKRRNICAKIPASMLNENHTISFNLDFESHGLNEQSFICEIAKKRFGV